MHELSLATEVIKLAEKEAGSIHATAISEITIEVGNISGVEAEPFESALRILSEGTMLEKATLNIVKINARGNCLNCKSDFEMNQRMDSCPECGSFPAEIKGGNEFRVVSLLVED
jgi:hydrogenase nickel incorporation protein HypA/HybF